jgi:ABC-type glycerol-3-phosphate transport system substrate-binding protein
MSIWLRSAIAAVTLLGAQATVPVLADDVTLTMWQTGGCEDVCLNQRLINGFEAANPGIKIKLVPQPNDDYFTALLSASLTSSGPDLAVMWPGGYMTAYKQYMVDIHKFVPAKDIQESIGTAYFSEDNDNTKVTYAAPNENQWYAGFYNKKLFAEAGITSVPTTWDELKQTCDVFKSKNITCIINGSPDAQFQPFFEFSYLATVLPPSDWSKLYDGEMKYDNPALVEQLQKWQDLYKAGYLNSDAFNSPTVDDDFMAGKAAMLLGSGTWNIPTYAGKMGDNLGIMLPPYSDKPMAAVVSTAGQGLAVMAYSKHQDEAGKFLAFVLGDAGQKILGETTAPTRPGFTAVSPQINDIIALSTDGKHKNYPMFDDFTQPGVTDAIYRNVALVLVNQMSPADALSAVDAAFAALPDEQKHIKIKLND